MATGLRIRGLVQGVGFRPTVWRLAKQLGLWGDVRNDGEGVLVRFSGASAQQIERFIEALRNSLPPLARIEAIEPHPIDGFEAMDFHILASNPTTPLTGIVADAATCPDCRAEIRDPQDRRHRYPFTNCTHCGPRLSIIRAIPYDRANTSMSAFPMCEHCAAEYADPANRRYHAQPNACPECGPHLWIEGAADGDPLGIAQACLHEGGILALKGIGGFHLACDATNPQAVQRLRRRKRRYAKPFALMARDPDVIGRYARFDATAEQLLRSPAAPIVLLPAREDAGLPPEIAPDSHELGFMLPYSPLHHLLLADWERPLVMTSGNLSDEPQCIDNQDAIERLGPLADCLLLHDRDIVNRVDDSVVRSMAGAPRLIRRARGYAPAPLRVDASFVDAPPILALGGDLKNTFCQLQGRNATLSQHLGDLHEAYTNDEFVRTVALYRELFDFQPRHIAVDCHPGYRSHRMGKDLAQALDVPLTKVQHHHAHIASVMAEHGLPIDHPPLIGIALDGLGFGDDGSLWGGEILLANFQDYRRIAHLEAMPLPGGDRAAVEPWRNLYARLAEYELLQALLQRYPDIPAIAFLQEQPLDLLQQMRARGINSPPSSSAGRLFDAVAAALDLHKEKIHQEGQAAMALEQLALHGDHQTPPYKLDLEHSGELPVIRTRSLWPALLDDLHTGRPHADIALAFHLGLADSLGELAIALAEQHATCKVALSGGVLQNRVLLERLHVRLSGAGLQPLMHRRLPANDGGISLGQACIAAACT